MMKRSGVWRQIYATPMKRYLEAGQIIALANHFTTFLCANLLFMVAGIPRARRQTASDWAALAKRQFQVVMKRLA
jgi:hypothetical protein